MTETNAPASAPAPEADKPWRDFVGLPIRSVALTSLDLLDPAAIALLDVGQRVWIRSALGRLRVDSLTVRRVDREVGWVSFQHGADLAAVDPGDLLFVCSPPGGHSDERRPTDPPPAEGQEPKT